MSVTTGASRYGHHNREQYNGLSSHAPRCPLIRREHLNTMNTPGNVDLGGRFTASECPTLRHRRMHREENLLRLARAWGSICGRHMEKRPSMLAKSHVKKTTRYADNMRIVIRSWRKIIAIWSRPGL